LQGPISLNRCLDIRDVCGRSGTCPVSQVLRHAQEELLAVLDSATLDTLAEKELAAHAAAASAAT